MLKRILVSFLFPALSFAATQSQIDEISQNALEVMVHQANQSPTIGNFIKDLEMPAEKKTEVIKFFNKNEALDIQMPKFSLKDKSVSIRTLDGEYVVNFELYPKPRAIINDQVVALEGLTPEQTHKRILEILYPPVKTSALMELMFERRAHAIVPVAVGGYLLVTAVIGGSTAAAITPFQLNACFGKESTGIMRCYLRGNTALLQQAVKKRNFSDFKCEDGQLRNFVVQDNSYIGASTFRHFSISYVKKNSIQTIEESVESPTIGNTRSKVTVTQFKNPKNSTKTKDLKFDRVLFGPRVAMLTDGSIDEVMNFPVSRLADCCADLKCVSDLRDFMKRNRPDPKKQTDGVGVRSRF